MNSEKEISVLQEAEIWDALQEVKDPEIPVISVVDMGIITEISILDQNNVQVHMTPTFTGCPAIEVMKKGIKDAVENLGDIHCEVVVDFGVTWNSNMITEKGRAQLEKFGLGYPEKYEGEVDWEMVEKAKCPHCGSTDTSLNSPFGSALCRSIHVCFDCRQTFERFKPV